MSKSNSKNKPMTFRQAQAKLLKLSKGDYHSISVEYTRYPNNDDFGVGKECILYLADHGHHKGATWEEAFEKLQESLNKGGDTSSEKPDTGVSQSI